MEIGRLEVEMCGFRDQRVEIGRFKGGDRVGLEVEMCGFRDQRVEIGKV